MILIGEGVVEWEFHEKVNVVQQQVAGVDQQITQLTDEFMRRKNALVERKQNLLALTNESKHGN